MGSRAGDSSRVDTDFSLLSKESGERARAGERDFGRLA